MFAKNHSAPLFQDITESFFKVDVYTPLKKALDFGMSASKSESIKRRTNTLSFFLVDLLTIKSI